MKQEVQRWERRAGQSGGPGEPRGKWGLAGRDGLGCCLANIHSLSPTVGRVYVPFSTDARVDRVACVGQWMTVDKALAEPMLGARALLICHEQVRPARGLE